MWAPSWRSCRSGGCWSDLGSAPGLSRWELATGLALGANGSAPAVPTHVAGDPCEVLGDVLAPLLEARPCAVSFSGGRDSSAVLAVATATARSRGLPDPIPVTLRFPGVESTEESDWQDLVVRRLGLREWERITIGDELDLLGPVARDGLRRHGLLWPPNAHVHVPILDYARGGTVLTGWDGDGLFGDWRSAKTPAFATAAEQRPNGPNALTRVLARLQDRGGAI
jgi:asparagine synthase